jgi:cell wall-associated NlpC family hydrolase
MGTQVVVTDTAGELWNIHLVNGTTAWVRRGDVWLTQTLKALPASRRRQMIVLAAQEFTGDPYFWGGRSPHAGPAGTTVTGVDCSGLVNLAYRAAGVTIPRDAHEQYLRARKMARPKPADLVFLSAPNEPKKIVHVMLYAGDGWLIEGPGTGLSVRRIEAVERFGRPLEQLAPGTRIGEQTLFFGAYLP